MLDQVLKLFNIRPDYDPQHNEARTGPIRYNSPGTDWMRGVLQEAKTRYRPGPGDTTTSTASALAAFYQQITVGHVEAGLRTHNIYSPWPEEMNTLLKQLDTELMSAGYETTPLAEQNSRKLVLITRSSPGKLRRWIYPEYAGNKDSGRAVCGVDFVYPMHLNPM